MNKYVKYLLVLIVIALVGYKSVYFKKLSSIKLSNNEKFDPASFTKKLWEEKLPSKLDSAIELSKLINALSANPEIAFSKYTHALDIGNQRYCLVQLTGTLTSINPDDIDLRINGSDSAINIKMATEYVYGNAIRDASGLLDIKDFNNTMDLNNISGELNQRVRQDVLPAFKKAVKTGDTINMVGAIELNKEHFKLNDLEIIPVRLKIQ